MDPVTLTAAAAIIGSAAAGAGAVMSYQQGRQQSKIAKANAEAAQRRAAVEAEGVARDRARRMGLARAQFGASGVQFAGTPVAVLSEQAAESEFDRLMVLAGGASEAQQSRWQGKLASQASYGQAISQLGQAGGGLLGAYGGYKSSTASATGGSTVKPTPTTRGVPMNNPYPGMA